MERRRYPRVSIKSVAKIAVPSRGKEWFAFVGSISRGGLELYCQEPLPTGHEATIQLTFLNRQGETLQETLRGTIRWCAKLGEATIAGVEFATPIEQRGHATLWAYLAPHESAPDRP
jgi:c-di-GMP-binding flagellar brake protein YcgR